MSAPAQRTRVSLGTCAFGRAVDAHGNPLDGGPSLSGKRYEPVAAVPLPAQREPVNAPLWTGIRAIDGLLALGRGARIGIFGGPGSGKSTLVERLVSGCRADAVVVGLVGERGREAEQWMSRLDARTTIVCATSDRPAFERIAACNLALAQAAALRARGLHVLLLLDSLARTAQALREMALAAGESAGRGGFPPSVFAKIAQAVEVAGPAYGGSITMVATVLDDGDARDPVSDAARSLLDGHVQLSARIAAAGRYPAVDVCESTSRTMGAVVSARPVKDAQSVRAAIALLDRIADARALGIAPDDAGAVTAVAAEPSIEAFLRQGSEPAAPGETLAMLRELADILEGHHGHRY